MHSVKYKLLLYKQLLLKRAALKKGTQYEKWNLMIWRDKAQGLPSFMALYVFYLSCVNACITAQFCNNIISIVGDIFVDSNIYGNKNVWSMLSMTLQCLEI